MVRSAVLVGGSVVCALMIGCGPADERAKDREPRPDAALTETRAQDGASAVAPGSIEARSDVVANGSEATAPEDGGLPVPPPLFPRGLAHSSGGVSPGYVLFNPLLSDTSLLIDNDGSVVHKWKTPYAGGGGMYLLENGNLLRPARDPDALRFTAGGTGGILQEFDWDGEVVWEWRLSADDRVQHHDVEPLPNGNLLVLAWELKTAEESRRVGRSADRTPEQGLWPDYLLEVKPTRPRGAEIVWEWHAWDHLVQNTDPQAPNYGEPAAHPGRIDINAGNEEPALSAQELAQLQALGYVDPDAKPADLKSDFLHVNAVAYHPRLDQIALSTPKHSEIWIIDHALTTLEASGPKGDLMYRWGNPATYGRGGPDDQRLFAQHDIRWIPDGADGAGNLTIFNNGLGRPEGLFSSIEEWTPPIGPDGAYRIADGKPFGPDRPAWIYRSTQPDAFFSPIISGAERLGNGSTLICEGTGGRILEVDRKGELLWEYRNPFSGDVRNADGSPAQPIPPSAPYAVFRAARIPPDHPGLAGRALEPLDPQPPWFEPKAAGDDPRQR